VVVLALLVLVLVLA
jgi:hypothetical protein